MGQITTTQNLVSIKEVRHAGQIHQYIYPKASHYYDYPHSSPTSDHRVACTNLNASHCVSLSGVPDYFGRNKISSGGDLSHYSSASLY